MNPFRGSSARPRAWLSTGIGMVHRHRDGLLHAFADQLSATVAGAELVGRLVRAELSSEVARGEMHEVEHAGDAARRQLVGELSSALTSPIDGEDLFRLSRSIDDVLDNLRDFVREADLFQCESLGFAVSLVEAVQDGLGHLGLAVASVLERPGGSLEATLAARKAVGRVRRRYQVELARLFAEPLSPETLKRRELLRRLDVVALRLGEAADALADGELKRYR
ncbi:MAG: DUF47 family protein [Actinomycetota bacterium]|nr:DUF47 family protein [Actinomycetota bacterium]